MTSISVTMETINVAVLGATGMVGQRFIQGLVGHPFFEISDLTASSKSAGKPYSKATRWYLDEHIPDEVKDIIVKDTKPENVKADIVFSALPSGIAKVVEPEFAKSGATVASNASAYRMAEDVPLLIPEVNPEHLEMLEVQRENRGWDGAIITNPNCSTVMGVLPLKPIYDNFGIDHVFVSTMQAVSGAGYAGVPSMAILDNLIPFINKEEEKVEMEGLKILGEFDGSKIVPADFTVSASCNRVAVIDGHTESVFVKTRDASDRGGIDIRAVKRVMREFKAIPQELGLPTAPENPVIVREEADRPQPRLDRGTQNGMAVTVGRVREDPILDFKFTCMGHNTIRGAAGASILNAELLVKM